MSLQGHSKGGGGQSPCGHGGHGLKHLLAALLFEFSAPRSEFPSSDSSSTTYLELLLLLLSLESFPLKRPKRLKTPFRRF